MAIKKRLKLRLKKTTLGVFFVMFPIILGLFSSMIGLKPVSAISEHNSTPLTTLAVENNNPNNTSNNSNNSNSSNDNSNNNSNNSDQNSNQDNSDNQSSEGSGDSCQDSLGMISWLVCPVTGKLAEAVDWLYEKLEGVLMLNPVEAKDGSPIYEIWKYCLNLANVVFVIFVLIVIYSQITGYGINNYGIKRALPKLIVAAILINLSFIICSIAVDVSNIMGNGIRQLFMNIETTVAANSDANIHLSFWDNMAALVGGGTVTIGAAVIAFETGAIWMLIPVVLGALVSVIASLVTVAMRQAVVTLLIMIAPLAIVSCILSNTEQWFQRWKKLFFRMLVFYPMFSLLFGASSLAGFAIITSATDGFGLFLGAAVQTFPLFFSWSLMRMSGTFLEGVNTRIRSLGARPIAASRGAADLRRQASMQRHLAGRAYTPSMRLMQFMSNRRIATEADLDRHQQTVRNRALADRARRNYNRKGVPTRRALRAYQEQAENMEYQRTIARDENNFNKGLGDLAVVGTTRRNKLDQLDEANTNASDYLKAEQARGELIAYQNATGFHRRMESAVNAHLDMEHGFERQVDADGNVRMVPRRDYKFHTPPANLAKSNELARYKAINKIMDGKAENVQYAAATAAHGYDNQRKIIDTKMQKYFDLTAPTREAELKLDELTKAPSAIDNIDSVISGLRILNQRGDLDLVRDQIGNVLDHGVELGTHASQALGNFLMFEVKDRDPFLRRFGKYINLETAQVYNSNKRLNPVLTMDEFVTGEYQQVNPTTGEVEIRHSKMSLPTLMQGTPLDNIERTAMKNLEDMLKHAYTDNAGVLDTRRYLAQRSAVEDAMAPQFISAGTKYLSGSDQIKALVTFLTGYDSNGHARWEPGGDLADDAEYAEQYFRSKAVKYINDQTPSALLGLRGDYYQPLVEHLSKQYTEDNVDDWDEAAQEEHRKYIEELSDIQTRYGDLPTEEAAAKREADIKELKSQMAGAEFRQLLDSKGKLEQIYRTRRSGAANNAKDWVREWLGLDDEIAIKQKLDAINDRRRREHRIRDDTPGPDGHVERIIAGGFDQYDRDYFATRIQVIWDEWQDDSSDDIEEFYNESRNYVQETLEGVGSVILHKYADYHTRHSDVDANALRDYLVELIQDPNNY